MKIYRDKKDAFPNTKMIALGALKGGTGKTTLTFNLAGFLASRAKVLLIDCDPQGNSTRNLNISSFEKDMPSVKDIYEGLDPDPEDIILHGLLNIIPAELPYNTKRIFPAFEEINADNLDAFAQKISDNLDLIPSNLYLNDSDFNLNAIAFSEGLQVSMYILSDYLHAHCDYFGQYDYIIFDTNPSMTLTNKNSLIAADKIILVCDPDSNSAAGTDGFIEMWNNALTLAELPEDDRVSAVILNKLTQTILSDDLRRYMIDHPHIGDIVLDHGLKETEAYKWAATKKKPVPYLTLKDYNNVNSIKRATNDLSDVIEELMERGVL